MKSLHLYWTNAQYDLLPGNGWKKLQCTPFVSDGCWGINANDLAVAFASWPIFHTSLVYDTAPCNIYVLAACARLLLASTALNMQSSVGGIFPFVLFPKPLLLFMQLNPTYASGFSLGSHCLQEATPPAGFHSILYILYQNCIPPYLHSCLLVFLTH